MRDFLKDRENGYPDFLRKQTNLSEIQRESLTEVTSEVCRRDGQVLDALAEMCLQALHSEDVTQHPEDAGLHRYLPGLVQEAQQHREMFEDSRAAQSSRWTRKLIDFDKEKQNFCNKCDVTMMTAKVDAPRLRNWTNLEPHESQDIRRPAKLHN